MKKLSFLALAAVGLLFGACTNDDSAQNGTPNLEANGAGYLGISITLPTADNSTRANDDFTNGRADEFQVKNAYLLLFKGTKESDAVYIKSFYSLTNDWKDDNKNASETGEGDDINITTPQTGVTFTGGTGVTQTSVSVCKIDKLTLEQNESLFGYVIINAQGGLAAAPAIGTPFTEFAKKELDAADRGGDLLGAIGSEGLLMTNSPISDKGAGSDAPSGEVIKTLMPLDKSKIKNSSEAALATPAGCFYVERATAKVTVADGIADANKNITLGSQTLSYTIDGWQVFNTEPKFYNARQIESSVSSNVVSWPWNSLVSQYCNKTNTKYRFISKYAFNPTIPSGGTHTEGYRTYFAKDIQYTTNPASLVNPVADASGTWNGLDDRAFVPENTFDVDRQMRQNTTQVAVRLKFNGGTDLYTISDDASYYLSTTIGGAIASKVEHNYNVDKFKTDLKNAALTYFDGLNDGKYYKAVVAITAAVTTTTASNDADYEVGYTLTTTTSDTENGEYSACTAPTLEQLGMTTAWTNAKDVAEGLLTVKLYKGGLSYYNVRIKHFGEQETPWAAERATQPGTTIEQIYGSASTRTADYLGRYGVVRDNWYNLSIDAVAKLGSAEPIPVNGDTTPDDDIVEEYFISAHVHILPWVLRTQSVNF